MKENPEEFDPIDINSQEPVANITSTSLNEVTTTLEYEVKIPEEYLNDFMIKIYASDLRKARKILEEAKKSRFPIHEILLGISTTCLGCFLGALCSNIALTSVLGKVVYIIIPMAAVGSFIAYLFLRKNAIREANDIADKVLEYIVDPDSSVGGNSK